MEHMEETAAMLSSDRVSDVAVERTVRALLAQCGATALADSMTMRIALVKANLHGLCVGSASNAVHKQAACRMLARTCVSLPPSRYHPMWRATQLPGRLRMHHLTPSLKAKM
jgi:hypothetical protein